jgi:hypothetical protein
MSLSPFGVLGNAGCQESINAIDQKTQIEVFPGLFAEILVIREGPKKCV